MDPDVTFLYNGLEPVARVFFITATGYLTLMVLLRVSGQRTLSQMSPLDFVITVTLGSAFGRVITARDVALVEVVAAFGSLVLLQWIVAKLWGRGRRTRRRIALPPTLLYYDGQVVEEGLARHHLVIDDLHTAVRQEGMASLDQVKAVLMEGNGGFSVLSSSEFGDGSAMLSALDDD